MPKLLGLSQDPFASQSGSFIVIILTEVWKTTPFMALLLMAGLALVPEDLQKAAKDAQHQLTDADGDRGERLEIRHLLAG